MRSRSLLPVNHVNPDDYPLLKQQRVYRIMLAEIESAMTKQIQTYCPELAPPADFVKVLGNPGATYIVASGDLALAYHGLIESFSCVDVCFTGMTFATAFMKSDRERAISNGVEITLGDKGVHYSWVIEPESGAVRTYPLDVNTTGLTPIHFPPHPAFAVMRRGEHTLRGFYSLEELYGQYSLLHKYGPRDRKEEYASRLALVSKAMCSNFDSSFPHSFTK